MISRTWILLAALVWGGPAGAHAQSWSASRVDSHAPLGVMGDHTHEAGEWMLSFRAMRMVMDGNRTDTARVPADGVLVGYPVTPLRMPMDMYMVGAMYAPTDRLTLVGMVPVLDIGGYREEWQRARTAHWSKLDSNGYERLIQLIRVCLKGEPLWMVEQYWQGHQ